VADATAVGQAAKSVMINVVEIYNTGNTDLIDAVISPNYIGHYSIMSESVLGVEGFTQWVLRNRTAYPDFKVVINEMLAEGNLVCLQWTVTGTNTGPIPDQEPTGKPIRLTGLTLARIFEGKIVEEWITYDVLDLNRQLGVEAPSTL
jgi:predicted ester cyclase